MSINEILIKLNENNREDSVKIYIPSLKRHVSFISLSLQQQKDILKTGMSTEIFNILEFNIILNNVIDQNSLEKYEFNLSDRSSIAIALRNKFTNQSLEIEDKTIDTNAIEANPIVFSDDAFNEFTIEEGILKIYAKSPSLKIDQSITKSQLARIKKVSNNEISNIIGDMYIFEIAKYIQKLEIGDLSQDLSLLQLDEKLKILEQLPASLITKLNKIINQKFKEPEDLYLTVDNTKIPIDARLFV
jgi:hypothetical protein